MFIQSNYRGIIITNARWDSVLRIFQGHVNMELEVGEKNGTEVALTILTFDKRPLVQAVLPLHFIKHIPL